MRVGSCGGGGACATGEAGGEESDSDVGSKKAFNGLEARDGGGMRIDLGTVLDSNCRKRSVTDT